MKFLVASSLIATIAAGAAINSQNREHAPLLPLRIEHTIGDASKALLSEITEGNQDPNPETEKYPLPQGLMFESPLRSRARTANSKLIQIRHGLLTIKSMTLVENQFLEDVPKPCNDCYITAIQGDLLYQDGSKANSNSGFWLRVSEPRLVGRNAD